MEANQQVPYLPRSTGNQRWQTQPQQQEQTRTGLQQSGLRPRKIDQNRNFARFHRCGGFDYFASQCRRQDFELRQEATGQSSRPTEIGTRTPQ